MDLNIGVLMGGNSSEREISLKSGEAVYKALKQEGYRVEKIKIGKGQRANVIKKEEIAIQIKKSGINFAFIVLHGGFGENGGIQRLLEELSIPYSGSGVLPSQRAIDKSLSKEIFGRNKIPVPKYKILEESFCKENLNFLIKKLNFPLVVKPISQGSSIGISIVDNLQVLIKAISIAFKYDKHIIVEEYINGKEVTVGILGEKSLTPISLVSKNRFYDYSAKYEFGMTEYLLPAPLPKKVSVCVQKIALDAYLALGCSVFGRVDLMLNKKNQCFVLEVNTIPGFTEISLLPKAAEAEGICFNKLCRKIVELSIR